METADPRSLRMRLVGVARGNESSHPTHRPHPEGFVAVREAGELVRGPIRAEKTRSARGYSISTAEFYRAIVSKDEFGAATCRNLHSKLQPHIEQIQSLARSN